MLETILYADLGSAVTKLSAKGRTVCEESRVALDPGNSSCVLAVGDKCRGLLNAVPVYPVRGGAVANITLAAIMLRRMSLTLLKKRSLFGVELRLLLPGCCSQMQRLYAVDMARTAGFRRVRIMDSLLLSAAGGGLDVLSPQAVMTADLGRDKLAVGVFANGGAVSQSAHHIGSFDFERALQNYFAVEHGMLIGSRTAEAVKKSLHLPSIAVNGRAAEGGSARLVTVKSSALRQALEPAYKKLCSELAEALALTPPEAAADIYDSGIVLTGGGAYQYGLAEKLTEMLGVPVSTAPNAEVAAVYGASESAALGIKKKSLPKAAHQ